MNAYRTSEVSNQDHGPFTTIHLSSSGKKTTMGMTLYGIEFMK